MSSALDLHARIDELSLIGPVGAEAFAEVVGRALASLRLENRAALATRLRSVLHESVADMACDAGELKTWHDVMSGPKVRAAAAQDLCSSGMAWQWSGGIWNMVLGFVVSIDALSRGLPAVSRTFRQLASHPACWLGQHITLNEGHLRGATIRGHVGWGKAFRLLPALRSARTVRVGSFADGELRSRVLPALRSACQVVCPDTSLLDCSFCERHAGEHVDLPTPRRLTAARRQMHRKGGGFVLGNGPLQEAWNGRRTFRIRIEALAPGERIDIGVTSLSPHDQFADRVWTHRRAVYAEDLLSCWIVEASGLLVGSHAGVRIRDERWNARLLRAGDEVELAVTASGELALSVNGELRASWMARIQKDMTIYPVVDLFEGSPRVQILPAEAARLRDPSASGVSHELAGWGE